MPIYYNNQGFHLNRYIRITISQAFVGIFNYCSLVDPKSFPANRLIVIEHCIYAVYLWIIPLNPLHSLTKNQLVHRCCISLCSLTLRTCASEQSGRSDDIDNNISWSFQYASACFSAIERRWKDTDLMTKERHKFL